MALRIDLSPYAGKRVCVALSGGADSVALFLLLREGAERFSISLSAVHVEHGIRGEQSLADTAFVRELCAQAGVPLFCFSAQIPALAAKSGRGLEEEARAFRYAVFARLIREDKTDFVATAHHAGDNAESVLFHLFRGASLTGAGGVRPFLPVEGERGVVRPLLAFTKEEILADLRERGAAWREDATNADTAYARNFLRHRVLKPAKEAFPACEKNVYGFSRLAREDDDFLYSLAEGCWREEDGACLVDAAAPRPLFLRACVRALARLGVEKDYTYANFQALFSLIGGENGTSVDLPRGVRAVREYGKIALYRPQPFAAAEYAFAEGEFPFGGWAVRVGRAAPPAAFRKEAFPRRLYLDGAKLPPGCVLRPRRDGDVFAKFGGGTRKLKEFFIDEKIPRRERGAIPVLAAGGEVFAVCGAEISEKAKLDKDTREADVFSIEMIRKGENECIPT